MSAPMSPNEPIAIIGSACRFAGDATSPSKLWDLLREPKDIRQNIPDSRFSTKGFYHPNGAHHGHSNVTQSYLIDDDLSVFDAEFFNVNPIEARAMDPQQRVLMEVVYEALESAGQTIEGLRGTDTGVYAGVMTGDWEAMQLRDLDSASTYFAIGTSRAVLSNRIAYFFDWHGAAVTIDTACSSSLVAVHDAVQALRSGDSRMAVACGANLILGPENYIIESKLKMLSPDGLSRMWDKDANGYARGDGVAAIFLKPLSHAIADGDDIECIIRETGVNQDGHTAGLTMPSASAQQSLIHRTYGKAGLDLSNAVDRPQYFEAHGTGTPAGDPVEAQAIQSAFFDRKLGLPLHDPHLYVGSIKTVLGHTEGTAGLAAILKASLAIQNSVIPPNLHFNELNPIVAPFYKNLEIATTSSPWPNIPEGQPKRASVNSFGFGGTNAHAILESHSKRDDQPSESRRIIFAPYVFSASSERSLRANLRAYAEYLDKANTNSRDLAYTLHARRSLLSRRLAFPAVPAQELGNLIRTLLEESNTDVVVKTSRKDQPQILGVFTGQGAQCVRMGASLIENSPLASTIISQLEDYLNQLPPSDRPTWSLRTQLLAEDARVSEAEISQPLCTAVQILITDLLRTAGVAFSAVVGHSSGEIAAAYAAGVLTARDAIYVAYYRGFHCKRSASPNGQTKGAMLAVGTSIQDALDLCADPEFAGRVNVAASNSFDSVTISGDEDGIEELRVIFEDENKFARRLKVDQAYHSSHMAPCYDPYIQSLRRAGVSAQNPGASKCLWYSSVHDGELAHAELPLEDEYWAQNMTKPVMFFQAISAAASATNFDVALEIGSHPALQGPASQTINDVIGHPVPYHGTLARNSDAVKAFSASLGFLWSHLGRSVDLQACETAISSTTYQPQLIKNLPSYQWSHETSHWHESRRSRAMRLRSKPFHQLLGNEAPESASHHLKWRNILKPSEVDWLQGHQVQGQLVFPAAGYVSTAIETAKILATGQNVRLIEINNFHIHNAVMFDGDAGVEVHIDLQRLPYADEGAMAARFSYSAAVGGSGGDLTLAADGEVRVILGEASTNLLPGRKADPPHLINVEQDRLYNFMESLEYNFTGPFRSLKTLKRKLGKSQCTADRTSTFHSDGLTIHPVDLDAAFQAVMLAYSYPGDDQLRNLHLPTSIAKIRVNPMLLNQSQDDISIQIDSSCDKQDRATPGAGFSGQVEIFTSHSTGAAVQVDQVHFKPIKSGANSDRSVFNKMDWVPGAPDGHLAAKGIPVTQDDTDLLWVLSRLASYYLRKFDENVPEDAPARKEAPLCHYLNYARHMTNALKAGTHKYAKSEWALDTLEDIRAEVQAKGVQGNSDVRIMFLVGETMPRVFKGETTMLEHFRESGLLDEYYAHGFGTMQSSLWLSQATKQITDRHPHLNILEIGAGTGGATKNILNAIGQSFDSYTFTDISSSFFENAADIFAPWRERMVFKVCDAEKDPSTQGFLEGAYDVVIGSLVVHATAELDKTMRNLRKLLKPGGFLIIGEGSSDGPLQSGDGFIFGALPGWWLGVEEGRNLSPFINVPQWDSCLKRTGFSGIDTLSPPEFLETFGVILFVSQAIDDRMTFLRSPLEPSGHVKPIPKLAIIGGKNGPVSTAVSELKSLFQDIAGEIVAFDSLESVEHDTLDSDTAILSLTELDQPAFKDVSPARWYSFRRMFEVERTVLWVTSGRLEDEPYSNMIVGFGRSAVHELEGLRLQFLDIADIASLQLKKLAEIFVRHHTQDIAGPDLLHVPEPEILLDLEHRELVPRLSPIADANERYNSIQRPITYEVDMMRSAVAIDDRGTEISLKELSRFETDEYLGTCNAVIELRTILSTLTAVRTDDGYHYAVLASSSCGSTFLALISDLRSSFKMPEHKAVKVDLGEVSGSAFLACVVANLAAAAIVKPMHKNQVLVVHNSQKMLATAISQQAEERGINVVFTADENQSGIPDGCILLPSYSSRSDLDSCIPRDIVCFAGLSSAGSDNQATIAKNLPVHCRIETTQTVFSTKTCGYDAASTLEPTLIEAFMEMAQGTFRDTVSGTEQFDLDAVARGERPTSGFSLIDWASSGKVTARRNRFDHKKLFKADKTYWLCGMSGALGISLCDWMIERGMRNLVLTSRNPKVEDQWLRDHQMKGVRVEILPCDVTDKKSLVAVHEKILETFPPIAGVLNGAMVLRDSSVRNMEFDQVTDVIRPKVLGSQHLDEIFFDVNLDFFILLSSINCVIGNVGQANYAAANMGMVGVAAKRRKRGLNSIAVNVGAIIGVGYITQSDRQLDQTVAKMAMMHLSDDDFHQIFAEAMEGCCVDSTVGPELSTGLLDISPDSENIPKWYSNPKFARFIVHRKAGDDEKKDQGAQSSISERLQSCSTEEDVLQTTRRKSSAISVTLRILTSIQKPSLLNCERFYKSTSTTTSCWKCAATILDLTH